MNKKKVLELKSIMGYNESVPEHRRMLKNLKKQYSNLSASEKKDLVNNLKKLFEHGS